MLRHIDPPKDDWERLPTPLTTGEREVFELFDAKLPSEWEMYIQPHLNGLRPDLVLLNPSAGIAVYEIKDWNLNSLQSSIRRSSQNPFNKIKRYEDELLELYCPRLNDSFGHTAIAAVTAGLIFTMIPERDVERLRDKHADKKMQAYHKYYPSSGSESLKKGDLDALFPEWRRKSSKIMCANIANDLRGWLKEPAFSKEQRAPLDIDMRNQQGEIVRNREQVGYRRVKGPAGSGKSVALAARAAVLASEGKRVLVCSYNILLINYLRDLVARHTRTLAPQYSTAPQVIRRQIAFLHFHYWCKRVCFVTDHEKDYKKLWNDRDKKTTLNNDLPDLVHRIYDDTKASPPYYDAILVDEGQDYRLPWWNALRRALAKDGEMLLVADKTQDIYGTATAWTDEPMPGAGFHGPWMRLPNSYRLPPRIIPFLKEFVDTFPFGEADIPIPQQSELDLYPVELRWVHISSAVAIEDVCFEEARLQMQRLRKDTAIPDITLLSGVDIGVNFVEKGKQEGIRVLHTFDGDNRESRRKKLAFYQGRAEVRATTLHSFKGWEARHLVVHVDRIWGRKDRSLLYTALTRLKRNDHGSSLTVVSSCDDPDLYRFGEKWPEFVER